MQSTQRPRRETRVFVASCATTIRRARPLSVAAAFAVALAVALVTGCPTSDLPVREQPNSPDASPELPIEPDVAQPGTPTPEGTPEPEGPGPEAPGPEACADLAAEAVPVLPRSSNHEVWQLYSDLVGEPLDADLFTRWTPLAQVRGFDNMTESRIDSQTLEEQLKTTEAVAELLVASDAVMAACPAPEPQVPVCAVHAAYDSVAQFSGTQGQNCWSYLDANQTPLTFDGGTQRWVASDAGLFVWATGLHPGIGVDVIRRWTAPVDGTVRLQGVVSDADPGGGDGISAEITSAAGLAFQAVIVNGGASESFDVTLNVARGEAVDVIVRRGATNSWDSTGLTANLTFVESPPSSGLTWANCGQPVVDRIASRAYRRPLRADEMTDLQVVFDEVTTSAATAGIASTFLEGLKATLQAALLSPHVQYKPEFVPGTAQASEVPFRKASRLALYFRSSFPDDELWALAEADGLSDAVLTEQAQRLLLLDGTRFVDNFGGQWLNFRGTIGASETPLEQSMRREAHDVFAAILDEQLPPGRLIAPGFTIVDGPLAEHYGLATTGTEATRISTDERGGVFTQGHFLTASTGSDFKRVIHRGIYALNRTLCSSIPPLDPATLEEISESVEGIDPALPLSERMEIHRNSTPRCSGCHSQMDPLGLALEHYDDDGRWRDVYPDGSLIDNGYAFNGTSVRDPEELKTFVGESAEYRRCVAEKLFTFGLHRAPRAEEACVIDDLAPDDSDPRSLHDLAIEAFLTSLALTETP